MTNNLIRPPSAMHPPIDKAHTHGPDRVAGSSNGAKSSKDITGLGSAQDARGARYSFASFSSTSPRLQISQPPPADAEFPRAHAHPSAKRTRPAPTDNSWYTANAYDVTPKFTRLGLAGPGVVLPVSARAHRKQQQSNPSASNVDKEKEKRASIASFQLTRRSSTVSSLASTSTSTSTRDGIGSAWLEAPSPSTHSSSSSPSPTPTCSSPASSVSSLPLTIMTPKSAASSQATSLVSSSRTSIEETGSGTAKLDNNSTSHQDSRIFALKKRQSVSLLSRMASWRRSTPAVDEFEWSEQHEADWALIEKAQPMSLNPLESEKGNLPHASVNVAVTVEVHLDPAPLDECSASAESETESRESVFERGDSGRYVDPRVTKLALRREKNAGVSTVKRCGSVRRLWKLMVGAGPGSLNHHPIARGEVTRE
ncbi:hypothetical protein NLJ89_g3671 [Agrocybe chaxingu]|uniref:Uncharacterized protein n=1 Tax=Agrocybe chaxingu TaxID=84603 RepID=A0A9W8K4U1_9AGAR|nr:hypothetical protein NLJ89_g3671 [Agrocybe chaxingu]